MNDETTSRIIELFQRASVCLSWEEQGNQESGIHDFTDCLPQLGECNALIFCVPGRKESDLRHLVADKHGRMFHGIRVYLLDEKSLTPASLFRPRPGWQHPEKWPMVEDFWGHYSKFEIETEGKRRPLDLLHFGIGHEAVSLCFLKPHAIKVATIIANPPYH